MLYKDLALSKMVFGLSFSRFGYGLSRAQSPVSLG